MHLEIFVAVFIALLFSGTFDFIIILLAGPEFFDYSKLNAINMAKYEYSLEDLAYAAVDKFKLEFPEEVIHHYTQIKKPLSPTEWIEARKELLDSYTKSYDPRRGMKMKEMPARLRVAILRENLKVVINMIRGRPDLLTLFPNLPYKVIEMFLAKRNLSVRNILFVMRFLKDFELSKELALFYGMHDSLVSSKRLIYMEEKELAKFFEILFVIRPEKVTEFFKDELGLIFLPSLLVSKQYDEVILKECISLLYEKFGDLRLMESIAYAIGLMDHIKEDTAHFFDRNIAILRHVDKISNWQKGSIHGINLRKAVSMIGVLKVSDEFIAAEGMTIERDETLLKMIYDDSAIESIEAVRDYYFDIISKFPEGERKRYEEKSKKYFLS